MGFVYKRTMLPAWMVDSVSIPSPPLFVFTLASNLSNSFCPPEDTAGDQPVAYATGNGGVTVEGYHPLGPAVEWMTVSGIISTRRLLEMLIMRRQGLPQGCFIPDNFGNNFVEASDTVLLYSPMQRPGPLSYMVSSEAV